MQARRSLPRATVMQARVYDCCVGTGVEQGCGGDERTGSREPFLLKFFIVNDYSVLVPPVPFVSRALSKMVGCTL